MTVFSYLHCNFNHHHHYNWKKKQKQNENDHDSKSNCIGKNHNKTTTSTNSKAKTYNSDTVSNNNFNHHYHHNWKKRQEHTKNANFTKSNCTGNSCDKTKTQKCGENNFLKLTGKSTDNNSRGKVSDDNIFKNGKIGAASNEINSLKTKVKPEVVTENNTGSVADKTITSNAQGKVSYNNNFENGEIGAATNESTALKAKVKPKVITENGNSFLRITGSVGDETSTPKGGIRAEVDLTPKPGQMPKITEANRKQSYSFDVRFNDDFSGNFTQFFQNSSITGGAAGYGNNGANAGPALELFREKDGTISLRQRNNGGDNEKPKLKLGKFADGEFAHVEMKVDWTHNTKEGEVVILVNGVEKARVKDATTIGPLSDLLPAWRCGLYNGTQAGLGAGQVDFDNIKMTQLDPDAKL